MNETFDTFLREVLGSETDELLRELDGRSPVSIRYNPFKLPAAPEGCHVPWNRYGYYLAERPQFTFDPLFQAGVYYVQEASSMFVGHLIAQAFGEDLSGRRVLDLCASPGGKTTLYSTLVGCQGVVVANETVRSRVQPLVENVRKWGLGNVVVTNNDPSHFASLQGWFDVVAVDAPCSGEGMFRKTPEAREQWSEDAVRLCAARQRRIVSDVWNSLKEGGVMIYSTCTFNRYEDEENVRWIAETFDCQPVEVELPEEWGVVRTKAAEIDCFRFFPHKIKGEGFFAAIFRKPVSGRGARLERPRRVPFSSVTKQETQQLARWVAQSEQMSFAKAGDNIYGYYNSVFQDVRTVSERMGVVYSGVCMGQMFGSKLKPDHALALFHDVNHEQVNMAELSEDEAVSYLSKGDIAVVSQFVEGINLVTFEGHPIGWAKRIGGRINNMLPKELRIVSHRSEQ